MGLAATPGPHPRLLTVLSGVPVGLFSRLSYGICHHIFQPPGETLLNSLLIPGLRRLPSPQGQPS